MKLRYFFLTIDDSVGDLTYQSHFEYHTYFIGHYLSKEVRKLKFETDGTFKAINVTAGMPSSGYEYVNECLCVGVPFDAGRYDNADEKSRCKYYVELMKTGILKTAKIKKIPVDEIMELLASLEANNYIYTWKLKNISIPEYNLKLKFNCYLTTNDFTIRLSAYEKKTLICEGNIVRTLPDYIHFGGYKVKLKGKSIVVYWSRTDTEYLSIDVEDLANGKLVVKPLPPSKNHEDYDKGETFYYLQKGLMYDSDEFPVVETE